MEINKITDFFHTNFHVEISNKNEKIKNVIKSTNFDNLKKMENKNGFAEKSENSDLPSKPILDITENPSHVSGLTNRV